MTLHSLLTKPPQRTQMSSLRIHRTKNHSTSPLLRAWLSWLCLIAAGASSALGAENQPKTAVAATAAEYALVTPLHSKETVLVSSDGKEQHVWTSTYEAASGAHLLPDGSILRVADSDMARPFQHSGLRGGRVQRIAWNGEVLWDFWNAGTFSMACGEALMLPNGNVLMATVERVSQEDALKAGRDRDRIGDRGLYLPGLLEVSPRGKDKGRIVWKWNAWDHVMQDRNPNLPNYDSRREQHRRIDINSFSGSFGLASVGLSYDAASDLILLTLPATGEFWLVDHSTTTQQAKTESGGKRDLGGSILWRWSPATVAANPPRAVSADFLPQGDAPPGSFPVIGVLALHGPQSANTMRMSLERIQLKSTDLLPPLRPVERQAWLSWDLPFSTTYDLPNSVSFSAMPDGLVLSKTGLGSVSRAPVANPIVDAWRYASQRGAREQKVRVGYSEAPCCGQIAIGKGPETVSADTRPVVPVKAARIGRPHLYNATYVGDMTSQTVSAAASEPKSPQAK